MVYLIKDFNKPDFFFFLSKKNNKKTPIFSRLCAGFIRLITIGCYFICQQNESIWSTALTTLLRIKIDMFLCSGSTAKMKNILKGTHNTPNQFSKYVSADASAIFILSLYYLYIILCSIHNERTAEAFADTFLLNSRVSCFSLMISLILLWY